VLFLHTLDARPREISFSAGLPDEQGKRLVNLLTEDHSRANDRGRHDVLLEPYGYRWYRVGGLDYLLKRSEIEVDPRTKPSRRGARSTK
jgi:maltose alpha-D-glucosyltransferase/alpha-amylase